jgi:hypothetical protein
MKQKELQSLLFKIIVFVFIAFLLDFVMGTFFASLYSKQKPGEIYRITYSIDSTKQDVLIFGSSTANHHYIPEIFKKRMNLSCYNTGKDNQMIFYNYAILKAVLERYSPKVAVLDIDRGEFKTEEQSYDRLSALIPYYKSHPEIRKIIELRSPYEKYKMFSRIYPYNSLIFTMIMGAIESQKERKDIDEQNGYIPLTDSCYANLIKDTSFGVAHFDSVKINAFESFVRDCKRANVKLYIVISPLLVESLHEDPSVTLIKQIAKRDDISVYDFSNSPLFVSRVLFAGNGTHLNDTGARIFTNQVIDSIMKDQKLALRRQSAN